MQTLYYILKRHPHNSNFASTQGFEFINQMIACSKADATGRAIERDLCEIIANDFSIALPEYHAYTISEITTPVKTQGRYILRAMINSGRALPSVYKLYNDLFNDN